MIYDGDCLMRLLRATRRRRRVMLVLRGIALVLGSSGASLLLAGWAAYRYRHDEGALLILRAATAFAVVASVYLLLIRPLLKRISNAQLARLIEERHPSVNDRFVAAVEFSALDQPQRISPAIINRLVADADQLAATIHPRTVIARRRLWAYGAAAVICILFFAGTLQWWGDTLFSGVTQLVTPATLAAAPDALTIVVKPGTARVPKNSDQQVTATIVNFDAAATTVTFFSRAAGGDTEGGSGGDAPPQSTPPSSSSPSPPDTRPQWVGQVMEPAKAQNDFQFVIFNIQDSIEYFVEANGVRSEVYRLDVVDLPFVKQIDVTLNFPSYTRMASKTTEDGGEIAALKGTVALITARLTGQVRSARIVLRDGRKIAMQAAGETNHVGAVTVTGNTSYHLELVSVDGETYRGSNEHDITMLEDQLPIVTFEKPGRDTRATSLEEVFTQAKAEDDYGVASIDLYFSINGGPEQRVALQKSSRDAGRTLIGTHTFFLEEYNLKPGDVASYYAKARDAGGEATTDIYFIEVKPFEMQYKQAQQQGGGGGGGGGEEDQNALTRRQKDLIAATFRLMREGGSYTARERTDGYNIVAQGQERLRDDALAFSARIRRRLAQAMGERETLTKLIEHIALSAREMNSALDPLKQQAGKDALPPEQRALQHLLSADAIFREMQVAFGNQEGGGGGENSAEQSQELSDLFELELDKMKNQYETLRREQQQQQRGSSGQNKDEMARKLEELARRQQQALEEQQRRQQQQGQPRNNSSGGGGGGQRQQQELIEETRRAARELERLSRERRDARLQELSRQLNQAADEMQQAQAASAGSDREEALARSRRALDRLEQARRRLQQAGQAARAQDLGELQRRAADTAARQREIAKEVDNLARRGSQNGSDGATREAKERLAERKDALAEAVNNLEQDVEQAARASGQQQQQRAGQQLRDAAAALRRNRVAERIRQNTRNIENNQYEAARAGERAVQQSLNELTERLQAAEQAAGRPAGSEGEEALDRTRQLADNLEALRRRLDQRASQNGARREGGAPQPNQQAGQRQQEGQGRQQQQQGQQGQQGRGESRGSEAQDGQSAGNPSGRFAPGGSRQYNAEEWGGRGDESRQVGAELRERLRDAEALRRQLGTSGGGDLTRGLDEAIKQLQRLANNERMGEAHTAAYLKAQVIDPLRQIELDLSRRLQARLGRSNLRLGDEGLAPERYRRSVDEYYKRLSRRPLAP